MILELKITPDKIQYLSDLIDHDSIHSYEILETLESLKNNPLNLNPEATYVIPIKSGSEKDAYNLFKHELVNRLLHASVESMESTIKMFENVLWNAHVNVARKKYYMGLSDYNEYLLTLNRITYQLLKEYDQLTSHRDI